MKAEQLPNGQYLVQSENLVLLHSNVNGIKINDCSKNEDGFNIMVSEHEPIMKPLFIALHNFKSQNNEGNRCSNRGY